MIKYPKEKGPTVTDISVLQSKVIVVPTVSDKMTTSASTSVSRRFYVLCMLFINSFQWILFEISYSILTDWKSR